MHPEAKARLIIDKKLTDSGWTLQDYKGEFNPVASLGVAVREFPTESGPVDYMLFVEKNPLVQWKPKNPMKGKTLPSQRFRIFVMPIAV